jgi:hypothetical protein
VTPQEIRDLRRDCDGHPNTTPLNAVCFCDSCFEWIVDQIKQAERERCAKIVEERGYDILQGQLESAFAFLILADEVRGIRDESI